ncbi:uncharacterized protein LY89DRAFT_750550 [Mollisia scopiformis]|uniref:Uncharacterized protein n=1 Tax=Mollisia scopiformis TaxID=149040 RepID=A0A194X4X3_MOLSC|nr:uncharacterized protein LY89DRAFT_750550 [Mollisia scopiformis]KUJ15225.1 hypothetical protein LY89DRAFT_750550 [Mollisia scopiformis]
MFENILLHDVMRSSSVETHSHDIDTVRSLQMRAPSVSLSDRVHITHEMDNFTIFSKVTNVMRRDRIKQTILQLPGIIPTIKSFHENLKFLETAAKIIKREIFDNKIPGSLYQAMQSIWRSTRRAIVEVQEGNFRYVPLSSEDGIQHMAYVQVFLSAFRNFPQLSYDGPLKEKGEVIVRGIPNATIRYQFLKRAQLLGFQNAVILKNLDALENALKNTTPEIAVPITPGNVHRANPIIATSRQDHVNDEYSWPIEPQQQVLVPARTVEVELDHQFMNTVQEANDVSRHVFGPPREAASPETTMTVQTQTTWPEGASSPLQGTAFVSPALQDLASQLGQTAVHVEPVAEDINHQIDNYVEAGSEPADRVELMTQAADPLILYSQTDSDDGMNMEEMKGARESAEWHSESTAASSEQNDQSDRFSDKKSRRSYLRPQMKQGTPSKPHITGHRGRRTFLVPEKRIFSALAQKEAPKPFASAMIWTRSNEDRIEASLKTSQRHRSYLEPLKDDVFQNQTRQVVHFIEHNGMKVSMKSTTNIAEYLEQRLVPRNG